LHSSKDIAEIPETFFPHFFQIIWQHWPFSEGRFQGDSSGGKTSTKGVPKESSSKASVQNPTLQIAIVAIAKKSLFCEGKPRII
jgi:hypothetical protein